MILVIPRRKRCFKHTKLAEMIRTKEHTYCTKSFKECPQTTVSKTIFLVNLHGVVGESAHVASVALRHAEGVTDASKRSPSITSAPAAGRNVVREYAGLALVHLIFRPWSFKLVSQ